MTELNLEQKRKILESRLSLVESHLSFLQENINEAPSAFAPELEPDLAVLNQSPAAKDYWDKIGKPKDPGILKKIANFFRKGGTATRRAAGVVNPEVDTSDPAHVKGLMDKSLATSRSSAAAFKNKALNTTKDIDAFHNTVSDALDKFQSFSTTLPMNLRGKYEREVIGMAKNFFILLNNEKERIESYLQTLNSDLKKNGYNPAVLQSESKEVDEGAECEDIDKESLNEGVSPERWQALAGMKVIKEYGSGFGSGMGIDDLARNNYGREKKDRYGGDPSDEEKAERAAMAAEIAAEIEDEKKWNPDPKEEDRLADRRAEERDERHAEWKSSTMKETDNEDYEEFSGEMVDDPYGDALDDLDDFVPGAGAFGHSGERDDYFLNDRESGAGPDMSRSVEELLDAGWSTEEVIASIENVSNAVKKHEGDVQEESAYMKENDDEGIRMSRTYGDVPNQKELETIMSDDFYMNLKGSDRLAFDYSLASQNLQSLEKGEYDAEDLHALLSALLSTPDETLLNFHELEGVNELLGRWDEATDSEDIVDRTHNIASSILSNLGVEWI